MSDIDPTGYSGYMTNPDDAEEQRLRGHLQRMSTRLERAMNNAAVVYRLWATGATAYEDAEDDRTVRNSRHEQAMAQEEHDRAWSAVHTHVRRAKQQKQTKMPAWERAARAHGWTPPASPKTT